MKNATTKSVHNGTQKRVKNNVELASSELTHGLYGLFLNQLKDIYWAEKALTKAIPKMIKHATSDELIEALDGHLEVTKGHVTRLEEMFFILGEKATAVKCMAMEGLIKEGEQIMSETENGLVRDEGVILAGQKIEHYEIATYGTLCSFAKTLGEEEVAVLLKKSLDEEKSADKILTEIAESMQYEIA